MTTGWKRWICLAWLCLIPVSGNAVTPTAAQQQDIIAAFVGVFNAPPGGNMSTWSDFISGGGTTASMYETLANSSSFQALSFAYSSAATSSQFATAFTNQLIGTAGTYVSAANWTTVQTWILGLLNSGASRGAGIKAAVDALRATPATDPNMGAAAQLLINRMAVATDYTLVRGGSATSLSTLQSIIASVTTSPASVTAAIAAYSTSTGGQIVDTQPPTVPTGLTATAASASQINLVWTASTDNVGVTTYKVYRGGALLATLGNQTNYSDTGLTGSTSYSYTVQACDAAGNCSSQSSAATASIDSSTAFTITGSVTGPITSQTITATVQTAPADAGQSIGIYVAAYVGNTWFFKGADGNWTLWSGGTIPPPYISVNTIRNITNIFGVSIVQNMDLTSVPGAAIYVGYGLTQADMVSNAKYQQVATVTGTLSRFTLTVNTVGIGTVSVNPSASSYASGTVVSLVGVPGTGYNFSAWSGACPGSGVCTVTMNSNLSVTATFVQTSPIIDFSTMGGNATLNQSGALTLVSGITGGNGSYRCQVDTFANGAPPFGMTVSNLSQGGTCQVVGTPTQAGTYNFGICVIDTAGTQRCKSVTVIVSSSPTSSALSVQITSATCVPGYNMYFNVTGTVSGPVGTYLNTGLPLQSPLFSPTCSSWPGSCQRSVGDAPTSTWTSYAYYFYSGQSVSFAINAYAYDANGVFVSQRATGSITCP